MYDFLAFHVLIAELFVLTHKYTDKREQNTQLKDFFLKEFLKFKFLRKGKTTT